MKRVLAIIFLLAVVFAAWWLFFRGPASENKGDNSGEPTSIAVKTHSDTFNLKVDDAVAAYIDLKDAFVNADSTQAGQEAGILITAVGQIPLDELEKDNPRIKGAADQQISDLKANAQSIVQGNNLTEMRKDFYMVSENLYPFLKTIGYEGEKLYWQNCPMAFNGNEEANWLSTTRKVMNPYLGRNNPKYQNTMLHCGETMDSLYLK